MYTHYVSLGDSQTDCDHYALKDAQERGVLRGRGDGLGSGSLLWRNDDEMWPEFAGNDLQTRIPGLRYVPLALDGAVIPTVLSTQLPRAARAVAKEAAIVTLTIGGNDALGALRTTPEIRRLEQVMESVAEDYVALVTDIRARLPRALLILNTVYDPTDGTGILRGAEALGPAPIHLLERYNDVVREVAGRMERAVLADIHQHFLGHGIREDFAEGWYWRGSVIEPGCRGASEIRRLWLRVIRAAG